MEKNVVFIGGVGRSEEFGGELSKNKLIINRLKNTGVSLDVVDTFGSRRNPLKLWSLPLKLMRSPRSTVIFSTSFGNIRRISALIKKIYPKRRLILWVIGGALDNQVVDGEYSFDDLDIFDVIIVESKSMLLNMIDIGLHQTIYMPNFKDLSKVNFSCGFENIENELRCIFFSRIDSAKGVDLIFDAIENETIKKKNIIVDFYGPIRANYKNKFEKRVSQLTGKVRYCGTLNFFDGSGQEKLSQYHLSLFPTFWCGEGFPGVVVDSYSVGLPVLSSDWNHNPEFIINPDKFMFRSNDLASLIDKLDQIYSNRELLPEYSRRCKTASLQYDVNTLITDSFIKQYLKI